MINKTKIVICISVGLCGVILLINGLINDKKVYDTSKSEIEQQITSEIVDTNTNTTKTTKKAKKVVKTTKKKKSKKSVKTTKTTTNVKQNGYRLTHYGYDCKGCHGNTAIGYNVRNTIYYSDYQFGKVRICAMSKSMPLYSIIKIKNYKFGGDVICAVIDRGVGSGVIDLLAESEKKSSQLGIQKNVQIEILRKGK